MIFEIEVKLKEQYEVIKHAKKLEHGVEVKYNGWYKVIKYVKIKPSYEKLEYFVEIT